MKDFLIAGTGAIGAVVAAALGGWDLALQTLVGFMAVDYMTGLMAAAIFKTSRKTQNGALDSVAGLKGLAKKGMMLAIVYIGFRLDSFIGADVVRYGVIVAFMTNELISIVENAGLMGIPLPPVVLKAIETLNKKV